MVRKMCHVSAAENIEIPNEWNILIGFISNLLFQTLKQMTHFANITHALGSWFCFSVGVKMLMMKNQI